MKVREIKYFIFLFLFISLIQSCVKDDPGLVPTYISIDSIQLVSNPSIAHLEGSLSHNITDAWIFVNGEYLGSYELPATFPLLKEGVHTLEVKAGIKINGISGTRGMYSFYESYTIDLDFVQDSVIKVNPIVRYRDITNFVWMEDFDDGHSSVISSSRSDTIMELTSDPKKVFEGSFSGVVYLDATRILFEGFSVEGYEMPHQGEAIFLELDFKTNNSMLVGMMANVYGDVIQSSVLVLNPTDEWKKIYINMTNAVNMFPTSSIYSVYFQVLKQDNVSFPEVLIDNIKLVY